MHNNIIVLGEINFFSFNLPENKPDSTFSHNTIVKEKYNKKLQSFLSTLNYPQIFEEFPDYNKRFIKYSYKVT